MTLVNFAAHPQEDAAILMRYADHFAHGHGLVWNIGDDPVDGATDFLFTVVLGGVHAGGLSLEAAVRVLALIAHAVTCAVVYLTARRVHGTQRLLSVVAASALGVGPALAYTEASFGTPFFGLTVALSWIGVLGCRRHPTSWRWGVGFGIGWLIMGLTRPEGVILGGLMALALVIDRRDAIMRSLGAALAVVGSFGILYFLWRWSYFGYPLPNPYYKKGGGSLHADGLQTAVANVVRNTLPFLLLFPAALRSARGVREVVFAGVPAAGFTLLWVLLSNETNFVGRFQYPVVVLVALSWPALIGPLREASPIPTLRGGAAICAGSLAVAYTFGLTAQLADLENDTRYDIARVLRNFGTQERTMAVTEAGLLPLYSEWRTLDTWGLNDEVIAHHGSLPMERLKRFRPDVIMMHAPFSPRSPEPTSDLSLGPKWTAMWLQLRRYAEAEGYVLASSYGTPNDSWNYYVRRTMVDAPEIVEAIRAAVAGSGRGDVLA